MPFGIVAGFAFAGLASLAAALLTTLAGITLGLPDTLSANLLSCLVVISAVLVAPLVSFAALPRHDAAPDSLPIGLLGVFTSLILVPVLLAAAVLLHLYLARIPLAGLAPDRLVGWWSFGFGCALLAVWHVAWPLRDGPPAHVRWFYRFGLALLPLPLAMTAWALHGLVTSGGWTEWRIAGSAVAAWLTALVVLYAWRPHRLPLRLAVASMAAQLLLMALSPLSLTDIAAADQEARLRATLAAGPGEDANLSSAVRFLVQREQMHRVSDLAPQQIVDLKDETLTARRFVEGLGRRYIPPPSSDRHKLNYVLQYDGQRDERTIEVDRFQRVLASLMVETGPERSLWISAPSSAALVDSPPRLRLTVAGRRIEWVLPTKPLGPGGEWLPIPLPSPGEPDVAARLLSAYVWRMDDGKLSGYVTIDLLVRLPPAP